jgi:hypothetical protein
MAISPLLLPSIYQYFETFEKKKAPSGEQGFQP